MVRFLSIPAAVLLVLAAAGCSSSSNKKTGDTAAEAPSTTDKAADDKTAAPADPKVVTDEDQARVREWLKTKKLPAIMAVWGKEKGVDVFGPMLAEFQPGDTLIMRYMDEPESEDNRAFLTAYEDQALRHISVEKSVCPTGDQAAGAGDGEEAAGEGEGEGEDEGEGEGELEECYNPVFFVTLDESGQVIALWGTAAG